MDRGPKSACTRRFECRREGDGTWMVWDTIRNQVATLGGCELRRRAEERSRAACALLERIYRNRLDARSMRVERFVDQKIG